MDSDRRKRLNEVLALLAVTGDVLERLDALSLEEVHRLLLPTYELHGGVRLVLAMAQQRLATIHDEEKAARDATPMAFRYVFEFSDEHLAHASSLLTEVIGSYTRPPMRDQLRKLIEEARSEIRRAGI
jgi:hypothetical protein